MKKSNILIVVIAALLVVLLFLFLNKKTHKDWSVGLGDNNSKPYDISLIKKLIRESADKKEIFTITQALERYLPTLDKNKKYNYIAIGSKLYFKPEQQFALDSFMSAGNTAFICLEDFESLDDIIDLNIDTTFRIAKNIEEEPEEVAEEEYEEPEEVQKSDYNPYEDNPLINMLRGNKSTKVTEEAVINYNFLHPTLRKNPDYVLYSIQGIDTTTNIPVRSFKHLYFTKHASKLINAGYILQPDAINFVVIPWGKGKLILHCSPELFTNISLKDETRLEYAEKVLSHMSKGTILMESRHFRPIYENNQPLRTSPLSFILKQRSLRWAWYLTLATTLIFLFFASKRKQAVIPIIEPVKNTSLEFIKTVGQLYFLDKDHALIAREIRNHFFVFVKNKYQLSLLLDEEERFVESLRMKSEISAQEIRTILQALGNATNHQAKPNEKILMDLYHKTEDFYKRCK